ncbi:MAG: ATP phosphoribosyltransferase [Coriobacteriales bacterium]|nr:ATP phosphoribosyltransferase [Coriobacteriales bacterium]
MSDLQTSAPALTPAAATGGGEPTAAPASAAATGGGEPTPAPAPAQPDLRIAIPKGALYRESVALLAQAGLDTSGLDNPGRQLVFYNEGVRYFIVRPTDAPVFVSYGGVDCGICGKDSLLEAGLEAMELVDLGFGACRFVVAEPALSHGIAEDTYRRLGVLRVATKYPRITAAYYNSLGIQVELVKMHGNIELAPLCGMADRIVDITASGRTLLENDLVIVDEVLASTARFLGNPASVRVDPRVNDLARRLKALVGREARSAT